MTIAAHISLPEPVTDTSEGFIYECLVLLAKRFPEHHFILIFDSAYPPSLITEKNITPVLMGPAIKNRLLQHYYYNFKIPRLLSKYNADYFISKEVCSLRSNVSQLLAISQLPFSGKKDNLTTTDSRYLKKYSKKFVQKAAAIVVPEAFLDNYLQKNIGAVTGKTKIIPLFAESIFKPADDEKMESTKQEYCNGKSFFLFHVTPATVAHTITMLKAFSIFKKWQKSNMQLLVLFSNKIENPGIKELASYKYREDVKLLHGISKTVFTEITATAYAAVYLPSLYTDELTGINDLAAGVPLIVADHAFCKSRFRSAAFYTPVNETSIAELMMLLYKDETRRKELISNALTFSQEHSRENAATLLWQIISPDRER